MKRLQSEIAIAIPAAAKANAASTSQRVNNAYVKSIKPIFRAKCFDCHADAKHLPWYFKIPGPKHLLIRDMREAKKHMDMRGDFPFKGHGTPIEDLDALEQTLRDGSMPPLRYRIMHRGSKLSQKEKKVIHDWIQDSRDLIRTSMQTQIIRKKGP